MMRLRTAAGSESSCELNVLGVRSRSSSSSRKSMDWRALYASVGEPMDRMERVFLLTTLVDDMAAAKTNMRAV